MMRISQYLKRDRGLVEFTIVLTIASLILTTMLVSMLCLSRAAYL